MSGQAPWNLDDKEAGLVLAERNDSNVSMAVIAVAANWGPPISGRFDTDMLNVWFAVEDGLNAQRVVLYGTDSHISGRWREVGSFTKRSTTSAFGKTFGLYHFSGTPVEQFVVCLVDYAGDYHYDNNGGFGVNYRIVRYAGIQVTCIRTAAQSGEGRILVFPEIVGLIRSNTVDRVRLRDE